MIQREGLCVSRKRKEDIVEAHECQLKGNAARINPSAAAAVAAAASRLPKTPVEWMVLPEEVLLQSGIQGGSLSDRRNYTQQYQKCRG